MTMPAALLALLLLLTAAISAALGYAVALLRGAHHPPGPRSGTAQEEAEEAAALRVELASWRARAEELGTRADLAEERAERDGAILRALAPVRTQLEQVGARVETMERQRAAQHAALAEQLRSTALAERELARTTSSLEGALRSRSARGLWGEVELVRILEASGMMRHVDFSEQRSVGALAHRRGTPRTPGPTAPRTEGAERSRPDVVIHLPGEGHLALDAKAPMDAYLEAISVDGPGDADQERRARLLTAHARALRAHVDELAARRYDRALGHSPELVVLFVPAEPVLAAALEADPALMEHALSRGVALTSPASLLTLLRTCATAWARTAVNDDARELLELGRTLYERLGTVAGHLEALGGALRRSVTAYNRAVGSMETRLLVTARSLEALGADLQGPAPIDADAAQVRAFSSPELSSPEPAGPERTPPAPSATTGAATSAATGAAQETANHHPAHQQ
ncbi:DNA recombination protein RmuC [Actinomyces bowdenii]|uniref:DNA recombination protein RmuC n=1 Tax=Actinomyces bowdenii TaxID=131109 RepID=UPI001ABCFB06|nr:DNA recombination protein RmuC [Actinomyces bowdenii]MBO3725177.1 DNA recombination protein RmuC [Actinomyces bowdenii]